MLVAQRVKLWVEPLLYRTITVQNSAKFFHLLRILRTKPPSFLASAVWHIHYAIPLPRESLVSADICAEVLALCPGTTHVGTTVSFMGTRSRDAMSVLTNLQDLTTELGILFEHTQPIDARHRVFAHVTHLNLHDRMGLRSVRQRIWDAVPAMPSLTHLRMLSGDSIADAHIEHLLFSCPKLRILLLTLEGHWDEHFHRTRRVSDSRLVWAFVDEAYGRFWADWTRHTRGETCLWTMAEDVVRQRTMRQGSIPSAEAECIHLNPPPTPTERASDEDS
uniref:F-box domain-containing protein n=1 Tax=Mycena chlorophos TaxID=658473 RepID=A0ABQ0LV06_MYCCL|nr:predicted protein [Mycena chlorophos]